MVHPVSSRRPGEPCCWAARVAKGVGCAEAKRAGGNGDGLARWWEWATMWVRSAGAVTDAALAGRAQRWRAAVVGVGRGRGVTGARLRRQPRCAGREAMAGCGGGSRARLRWEWGTVQVWCGWATGAGHAQARV